MRRSMPLTPDAASRKAAFDNPRLATLVNANPAQVEAWVNTNVRNIADARELFVALLLAVRHLIKTDSSPAAQRRPR